MELSSGTRRPGVGGGFERKIRVPVSPAPQPGEALNLPAAVTPAPGAQQPCDIGEAEGGLGVRTGDQRSRECPVFGTVRPRASDTHLQSPEALVLFSGHRHRVSRNQRCCLPPEAQLPSSTSESSHRYPPWCWACQPPRARLSSRTLLA